MISRTERQKLGVLKWKASGCRGTLQYATGEISPHCLANSETFLNIGEG